MRSFTPLLMVMSVLAGPAVNAQTNLTLLGHLDYQALHASGINSIWGYSDGMGNEYALVGVTGNLADVDSSGGMSIVDVTDPANPVEVFFMRGHYCESYEAQVWGHHAYVTSRCGGGLRIIDLSPLPADTDLQVVVPSGTGIVSAHTTFIDEQGRLYVNGGNAAGGGVLMLDLASDPLQPAVVGEIGPFYAHDCYARGDTLYVAHISNGFFSIADVAAPSAPVLLGTQFSPGLSTHNLALDDGGRHLFTTDEVPNGFVGAFDITDLTDIQELDRARSGSLDGSVPHNAYWRDDFLAVSYYTYGVVVYDAMRPHNLVEVAHYDTSPQEGPGFRGAWGVYPYLPSQRFVVSDMEAGLFILAPTYQRACWLEGTVTNAETMVPVAQAVVTLAGTGASDVTGVDGTYATGILAAGAHDVEIAAPGYVTLMLSVGLVTGEVTLLDVQLTPLPNVDVTGIVREAGSTAGIEGAIVQLSGDELTYSVVTDATGGFALANVVMDAYDLTVAHWGHRPICTAPLDVDEDMGPMVLELEAGYYDDFDLDLGWVVSGVADTGAWVRDVPIATFFQSAACNPGADAPDDCGTRAFMTGNGTLFITPFRDRVGRARTVLSSPVFDASAQPDPHVRYMRWFADNFGTIWDDTLHVSLTNGPDTVAIEQVTRTAPGHATWRTSTVRISDHLSPSSAMRILFSIADAGQENVLEAAVDRFELLATAPVGMEGPLMLHRLRLFPNPNSGSFRLQGLPPGPGTIEVLDLQGRSVALRRYAAGGTAVVELGIPPGCYRVVARSANGDGRSVAMLVE